MSETPTKWQIINVDASMYHTFLNKNKAYHLLCTQRILGYKTVAYEINGSSRISIWENVGNDGVPTQCEQYKSIERKLGVFETDNC